MKIIAVIPAYNEEIMISDVVKETKKYVDDIVVVDDRSFDKTAYIISNLGVKIILHRENIGAGRSTQDGINAALYLDAGIVVTLDGDGQHEPNEIPKVIAPILMNQADIVVGSRFIESVYLDKIKKLGMIKIPVYRRFVNFMAAWLYNIGHKDKISDSQCCFRAFSRKALSMITITDKGFGLTIEPLIKARKLGLKIVEVPVSCIYHANFHMNSSMHPIKQAIITTCRLIYWRIKLWN